jgi:biotin transport system substrate-specific component
MILGNLIIYACGVTWLGMVIGWEKPVLAFGMYPFIPGDLLKIALAGLSLPLVWKQIGRESPDA